MKKLKAQDILYMQSEVIRFNKMMSNEVTNGKLIPSYYNFTKEEFFGDNELKDSYNKENLEGILDGAIDLFFTCNYWANLNGHILENNAWLKTIDNESDMQKVRVILSDLEKSITDELSFYSQTNLLHLLCNEVFQGLFDVLGAFEEVMSANMSKYVIKGTVNVEDEIKIILEKGRYEDISVEEVESGGATYLAFKALRDNQNDVTFNTPKLIKTRFFKEPELTQFIL